MIYGEGEIEERSSLKRIQVSELVFEDLLLTPVGLPGQSTIASMGKSNQCCKAVTDVSRSNASRAAGISSGCGLTSNVGTALMALYLSLKSG